MSADLDFSRPSDSSGRTGRAGRRVLSAIAAVLRFGCAFCAAVLVAYVVFVTSGANPEHWLVGPVSDLAAQVNLGMSDLSFALPDPELVTTVNYGAAAVAWMLIGWLIGRLLRRS